MHTYRSILELAAEANELRQKYRIELHPAMSVDDTLVAIANGIGLLAQHIKSDKKDAERLVLELAELTGANSGVREAAPTVNRSGDGEELLAGASNGVGGPDVA